MERSDNVGHSIFEQLAMGKTFTPEDLFIAVMGVTGSGKSTFISKCTDDPPVDGRAGTSDVGVFTTHYHGRQVHLIDTPGFNDTYKSDSDVLKEIAFWLSASFRENVRLSGIVYLHPITHTRMEGSAHKNLRMFKKLCGEQSLSSIVLVTTMWGEVQDKVGDRREQELRTKNDFWGEMISHGSRVWRHTDDKHSAMNILSYLLDKNSRMVLNIQQQMVVEGKGLEETGAGRELEADLIRQRELYERKLKQAQEETAEALKENDAKYAEEMIAKQEEYQKEIELAKKGREEIRISMEKLFQQKDEEFREVLLKLTEERKHNAEASKETLNQLQRLQTLTKQQEVDREQERQKASEEIKALQRRHEKENSDLLTMVRLQTQQQQQLALQDQQASQQAQIMKQQQLANMQSTDVDVYTAIAATAQSAALATVAVASMCAIM